MDARLLICGYSYHSQRFYIEPTSGLPHYLFRLQTEGRSLVNCRGKLQPMEGGDLLLLGPGDEYGLRVEPSAQDDGRVSSGDYFLGCHGDWLDAWWSRDKRPALTRIDLDERLIALWRQLVLEKRREERDGGELTAYLLKALCLYLDRAITETAPSGRAAFTALRLKRFIEEHATTTFRLEEAASHVGLSLSRAVHLFKECYGKTMIQYAHEIRINAALERMKYSTMTLEHIAETCGFASYSYFHRVFRSRFGVSPAQYRTDWAGMVK